MKEKIVKEKIKKSLNNFANKNYYLNAVHLFETLGYKSDLKVKFGNDSVNEFMNIYIEDNSNFRKEKALFDKWKEVPLLFQITQNELSVSGQIAIFKVNEFDRNEYMSYAFLFIELQKGNYTRGNLSTITREINKNFKMPVMILFKVNNKLTFSIINRRPNKVQKDKDVLEKVTLIKDIDIKNPHRAHIEILYDLSLEKLAEENNIKNFLDLHNAWQNILKTSELNRKFYKELSDWYAWALTKVNFPKLEKNTQEDSNSIALIRLITRIIFIWFMKERKLIPNNFFKKDYLNTILKFEDTNESTYYKAILQNLFFATLNQEKDKRDFRKDNGNYNATTLYRYKKYFTISKNEVLKIFKVIPFLNGGLFDCLDKPHPTKKGKQGGDAIIRIDGFSEKTDNLIKIPDILFLLDSELEVNLNDFYGTKNRKYEVTGLLEILKKYKFTVEESTPIEEEIALDPELLGQVFEKLLASYNLETKVTVRKSTGSYYTPRAIVNYLVDESIKSAIATKVEQNLKNVTSDDIKTGLEILFSYTEKEHAFNDEEITEIIKTISEMKIIDPACGSGAFPMGILHKFVFILNKLDPNNIKWKEAQRAKAINETDKAYQMGDKKERHYRLSEIEETFNKTTSDYGRKLFLIENCIFGVDKYPIATQISKLRFFISLLVDEKIDKTKPNWNIKPMPNLETKFVTANTLIGLKKPDQAMKLFENSKIKNLKIDIEKIRRKNFSAKTPTTKKKYHKQDKQKRQELAIELTAIFDQELKKRVNNSKETQEINYYKSLIEKKGHTFEYEKEINKRNEILNEIKNNYESKTYKIAQQLANWDPYDQNMSSNFFDKEWMFGVKDGFDIVIGNPPYIGEKGNKEIFTPLKESSLGKRYYQGKMDVFYFFFHLALDLSNNGVIAFITTNYYLTATGAKNLRNDFKDRASILKIINFGEFKIFESASGQHNMITILEKGYDPEKQVWVAKVNRKGYLKNNNEIVQKILSGTDEKTEYYEQTNKNVYYEKDNYIGFWPKEYSAIFKKIVIISDILDEVADVNQGIVTGGDKINIKVLETEKLDENQIGKGLFVLEDNEIIEFKIEKKLCKPFFKNSEINRFQTKQETTQNLLFISKEFKNEDDFKLKYPNAFKHLLKFKKTMISRRIKLNENPEQWFTLNRGTSHPIIFENSKIVAPQRSKTNTFGYNDIPWYAASDVFFITHPQKNYNLKYILGIINSKLLYNWLYYRGKRKGENLELTAKPLKEIPIAKAKETQQNSIIKVVDEIISLKKAGKDTKKLEDKIDLMVYKLYELTYEEVKIVDPDFLMSKEEYENE